MSLVKSECDHTAQLRRIGLTILDIIYVFNRSISVLYVLDAIIQACLVAAWVHGWRTGQKQLTHMPNKHQDGFAHWSPDGTQIVMVADLDRHDGTSDLFTMDANGKHITKIVSDEPAMLFTSWGRSR